MSDITRHLLQRLKRWELMIDRGEADVYWDLRVNHIVGSWFSEGKPDLAEIQKQGFGWIEKGSTTAGPIK
jgi:hypothetical protein